MIQRAADSSAPPLDPDRPHDQDNAGKVGPGEIDPAALATLVLACPGVAGMHGGVSGEAATYLPGSRVRGVRILPDRIELHVVARWPIPAAELAEQVWALTARAVEGRRVDVVIGDVALPELDAAP